MIVLVLLALLGVAALAPILAIVALVRANRAERALAELRREVESLASRVSALVKTGRVAAEAAPAAPVPAPAPPAVAPPPERPAGVEPATPPPPASAPVAAPPAAPPAPAAPAPPAALPVPAVVPLPQPAVAAVSALPAPAPVRAIAAPAPAPARASVPAPPQRPPRPPAPPTPPTPSFDWESLLGLKGAAWLGGITIVIAGVFLAKLAMDNGLFTPELRIATLILAAVGGLVWAELSLRRGYTTTANAVSGAAVATLYVAFYAARALYGLLPLGPTFALMALVTVVAGVLAIRYDALATAVLGLFGGFATPFLLSTGRDNPVGLFSYLLLLNLGLMVVAVKKRWHGLVLLGLAGTFLLQLGWWFSHAMSPERLLVGLGAFLIFGLLYLLLPIVAGYEEEGTLAQAAGVGAFTPFVFAVLVAGSRGLAGEWPLLFGYLALLDAALLAVALLRARAGLLAAGAAATAFVLPVWAVQGLERSGPWGPTLAAIGLAVLLNAAPRLARMGRLDVARTRMGALETAGLLATCGLGLFGAVLAVQVPAEPPWPFLVLLVALTGLLVERTGEDRLGGVALLGPLALALLVQLWFLRVTGGETLLRNLGVPLLLALSLSLIAAWRALAPVNADEDEGGVVAAALVAIAGLFACLATAERGGDPRPLFAALAVAVTLLVVSALRRDWTGLLPLALLASALFSTSWEEGYFHPEDLLVVLPIVAAFYLVFLGLPFALQSTLAPRWTERPWPWLASALAGPAFFLPLYRIVGRGWGKAWIGALPVLLAALSVWALAGVARRFAAPAPRTAAGQRRLRFLALFAAIALGFVALAVPLQLDRQWITVAWALEALAVWWLFGRLPHPGLKFFGALLYAFVGVRLLLNWEYLLQYQPRGLPVLNWLLYTYGVPAACCLVGAALLRRAEEARRSAPERDFLPGDRTMLAPATSLLGLLLVFVLINLEIVDFYSTSTYVEFSMERQLARDLTMSVAWGLYAMGLLVLGLWRRARPLRMLSLGFLLLTVAKVFLYDLSNLTGVYRILSFLGLGIALILVSLLYQRFVLRKEAA